MRLDHRFERVNQDAGGRVEQSADVDDMRLAWVFAWLLKLRETGGFCVKKADQFGRGTSFRRKEGALAASVWSPLSSGRA